MNLLERSPKIFKQIVASAAVLATVVGCSSDADFPTPSQNITEIVVETERFSILEAAVVAADLAGVLSEGEYTVFAPNDDAFVAALEALGLSADELLADTELLTAVLLYHVVPGTVDANAAISVASSDASLVPTAGGDDVALSISTENDANVLYVNTSAVIATNIRATNGIIHEVDKVILPAMPIDVSTLTIEAAGRTLPQLTTLFEAIDALGLDGVLDDASATFTVFAPTNDAFTALLDALGYADLGALVAGLGADAVTDIVLQHVVPDFAIQSVDAYAANGGTVPTAVAGLSLPVLIADGALVVGGATVSDPDYLASNGVVHIIDSVIVDGTVPTP
jgi:uncharacterized surface protein with fasciclin (FAS1) repeats